MNRRNFLKGLVAITGIPAVVAGVAKAVKPRRYYGGDERDLPFELPSMAKPRGRYGKSPVQSERERLKAFRLNDNEIKIEGR